MVLVPNTQFAVAEVVVVPLEPLELLVELPESELPHEPRAAKPMTNNVYLSMCFMFFP
jgi:hypothetical protein